MAGVGVDLHTYKAEPGIVEKTYKNAPKDWDELEAALNRIGHRQAKGTNYKLNGNILLHHPEYDLASSTFDYAYSPKPRGKFLNKTEAAEFLKKYEVSAANYLQKEVADTFDTMQIRQVKRKGPLGWLGFKKNETIHVKGPPGRQAALKASADAFTGQLAKAIKDPKVKAIGIEWE